MRKKAWLIFIMCAMMLITGLGYRLINERDVWLRAGDDGLLYVQFRSDHYEERIHAWEDEQSDEEVYYFFLPAFVKENRIWFREDSMEIYENGQKTGENGCLNWKDNEIYRIRIPEGGQNEASEQNVIFMRSENLPAVFIGTESGSMEYLHQSKENEERGDIAIISAQGNLDYRGRLPQISGRGNRSWWYEKKSYTFSLKSAQPLCGLDNGKKWNLLALAREGTKLSTKLAMDIGNMLEMEYSPQGTWIDLYLNGEYAGNYFLTESVSVGEGRVEIYDLGKENEQINPNIESAETFSEDDMKGYEIKNGRAIEGGYLLEFDALYFHERTNGVITDNHDTFTVRGPSRASREQLTYIKSYIQNIEDTLHGQAADYTGYLDRDSFVSKFLVEEITMNMDAYCTSTYFYKDYGDNLLYAGPIWDYDGAWGTFSGWENPDHLIVDQIRPEAIDWFAILYHEDSFYREITAKYAEILPDLETMLDSGIDNYADTIRGSIRMDEIRWRNHPISDSGYYRTYENNLKYLKSFFARRLNYLNHAWGISHPEFEVPSGDAVHEVSFYIAGELIDKREITDSEFLEDVPGLDGNLYEGWEFLDGKRIFWDGMQFPIYEDVVFEARLKETDDSET